MIAVDILQFSAGFDAERVLRIEAEEVEVDGLCLIEVAEVTLKDFAFGEQRAEAIAAARILATEEFVLADGVAERLLVLKDAAFFGEEIGDGGDGGVGFGRGGIAVVDGAIGVEDAVVLQARALLLRAAFESFAEALGVGKRSGSRGRILSRSG